MLPLRIALFLALLLCLGGCTFPQLNYRIYSVRHVGEIDIVPPKKATIECSTAMGTTQLSKKIGGIWYLRRANGSACWSAQSGLLVDEIRVE